MIAERMEKIWPYIREGELCSCPIITTEDGIDVAAFTYFANDEEPLVIFGYGQLIKTNGESVLIQELEMFEKEEDFIVIENVPIVSVDEHEKLYNAYYQELEEALKTLLSEGKVINKESLKNAFRKLIPDNALELYRRVCPSFLELIEL